MSRYFLSLALLTISFLVHPPLLSAQTSNSFVDEAPAVVMDEAVVENAWAFDGKTCDCRLSLPEGLVFRDTYHTEKTAKSVKYFCEFIPTESVRFITKDDEGYFESGSISLQLSNDLNRRELHVEIEEIKRFVKIDGNDRIATTYFTSTTGDFIDQKPLNLNQFPNGLAGENASVVYVEFFYR